jgi:hypothetical protein
VTETVPALLTAIAAPRLAFSGLGSTVKGIDPSPWPFLAPSLIHPAVALADHEQSRFAPT